jgi:hypothetical protein
MIRCSATLRSTSRRALSALLLACCAACSVPSALQLGKGADAYTEQDLREDLSQFATQFSQSVSGTSEQIANLEVPRMMRRSALLWKMRLVPLVRTLVTRDDPQQAYVSCYAVVVMLEQYFETGDGRELFGEQQPLAVETCRGLEQVLIDLGSRFLTPEQVQRVDGQVDDLARRFPIRGPDFAVASLDAVAAHVGSEGTFKWVVNIPMAPFRALGGVGDTPAAIREFAKVAADLGTLAEQLPEELRWQAELLAFDLEGRDTTTAAVAAAESLAQSAERVSLTVEALPETLKATLEDSRTSIAEADALVRSAQELSVVLEHTARELRLGSEAWERLLADDTEAPEPAGSGPPFDVRQWESAVREVGVAAAQLRALAEEVSELTEPGRVGQSIAGLDAGLDDAESRAAALIDRAALRAAQVLGGTFLLLLAWRLFTRRRTARPAD